VSCYEPCGLAVFVVLKVYPPLYQALQQHCGAQCSAFIVRSNAWGSNSIILVALAIVHNSKPGSSCRHQLTGCFACVKEQGFSHGCAG
jgi:hypothetical protein